jgi:hypothetical protein
MHDCDIRIVYYDPMPYETPEERARTQQRITRNRAIIRDILPRLRALIEDPGGVGS